MNKEEFENIRQGLFLDKGITMEQALELLEYNDKEAIYNLANDLRKFYFKNTLEVCTITNAKSGRCSEDCSWCSQSVHFKSKVDCYDLVDKDSTVKTASDHEAMGVGKHSLVTSGHSLSDKELSRIIPIYKEIRETSAISLCASMGLLNKSQLERLKTEAGVSRYHCNIESAPSHFGKLVTTHTIEEKVETIKAAMELGMGVCSGGILGMGETMEQRLEMAFFLNELQVDSIPLNILTPISGTPMENESPLTKDEILLSVAMFRIINPKTQIRLAGGRNIVADYEEELLNCGLSGVMTGDYLTTSGKSMNEDLKNLKNFNYKIT